jgi:single-stranded-DNA-specific exonuclease
LLIQFGGHKYAAGLTMLPENVDAFRNRFDEVVSARITPEQLIPELEIDAEIELEDINPKFYGIIQQMAPYGPENMKPVFLTRGVKDSNWSKIVKEEHIKFSVKKNNSPVIDGIGFRLAPKFSIIKNGTFDIAYNIDENVWNDRVSLQMMVKDVI